MTYKMRNRILVGVLVVLPLLAWAAWVTSGRQVFSKSWLTIDVPVRDELFGDTDLQSHVVRGPLFGYYVGLDIAATVTLAAIAATGIWWWVSRRRRGRMLQSNGAGHP